MTTTTNDYTVTWTFTLHGERAVGFARFNTLEKAKRFAAQVGSRDVTITGTARTR